MAEADYRRLVCAYCGRGFAQRNRGRIAKYCSYECRQSFFYPPKPPREYVCRKCGLSFLDSGRGRPWKVCPGCRKAEKERPKRPMGGRIEYQCERCGVTFTDVASKPGRRYCGSVCQRNHAAAFEQRRCLNCMGMFTYQLSDISRGIKGIFCSRACRNQDRKLYGHEPAGKRNYWALYAEKVDREAAKVADRDRREALRIATETAKNPPAKECVRCERMFAPRMSQKYCDDCAEGRKKETRRLYMKSPAYKASKKKHKTIRRARKAIEAESIDPIKVFERDGWRCHLCGCRTPRRLRGTNEPKAPELDHIVTLADGGSHTWGNVACACRACNIEKGAESRGQLGLGLGMAA